MAFTYSEDLSNDRDKVRFNIGDTVEDAGVRPKRKNFSDAEIDAVINLEGSWQLAVANCLESLATAWAANPSYSASAASHSESRQQGNLAGEFRRRAVDWRNRYGDKATTRRYAGTAKTLRSDSFTSDSSEYT